MKRLSDEEFDKLLQDNEMIRLATGELEEIFRNNFCLTEREIGDTIREIVSNFDEYLVLKLTDIFQKFVDNDIENFDKAKRNKFAKRTIKYCLELYHDNSEFIIENFLDVIKQSRALNIDPFKIAIKGNLKNATVKTFNDSLVALFESKYEDLLTGEKTQLLELREVKEVIEQCTSLVAGINEKRVQNVLDVLSAFVYDSQRDSYIVSPRELIKKSYVLLKEPSKNLERNIQNLLDTFVPNRMSKTELVMRIYQSPSILLCSPKKIKEFENILAENILGIIADTSYTDKKLNAREKLEYALKEAEEYCCNLDNYNTINSINKSGFKNIEKIRDILVKNLGANNALKCINKPLVLECEPNLLDCFLSKLAMDESKTGGDYRLFFIENTRKCMEYIVKGRGAGPSIMGQYRTGNRDHTIADTKSLPTIKDVENDYKNKYERLSERQKHEFDKIMDNFYEKYKGKDQENSEREPTEDEAFAIASKGKIDYKEVPYANMLYNMREFIDARCGDGFCDEHYNLIEFIEAYIDNENISQKFADVLVRLNEEAKNYFENAKNEGVSKRNLLLYKKTHESLMNAMKDLNKLVLESDIVNDKMVQLQKDLPYVKQNIAVDMLEKTGYFERESSSFATKNMIYSIVYLQYFLFMYEELKKFYPNRYREIISEQEVQNMLDGCPFFNELAVCSAVYKTVKDMEDIVKLQSEAYITSLKMSGFPIDKNNIHDKNLIELLKSQFIAKGETSVADSINSIISEYSELERFSTTVLFNGKNKVLKDKFAKNVDLFGEEFEEGALLTNPRIQYGYYFGNKNDVSNKVVEQLRKERGHYEVIDLSFRGLFNYLAIENEEFKTSYVDKQSVNKYFPFNEKLIDEIHIVDKNADIEDDKNIDIAKDKSNNLLKDESENSDDENENSENQ